MDGGGSNDRAGAGGSGGAAGAGGSAGSGGSTGGTGGSAGSGGSTGGTGGSAGSGGSSDGGGVDAPDAGPDGGPDGAAPTCNDGIRNSDETGVDCGGHCGKCGPGNPCLVNADCLYACKADMTCSACSVAADCPGVESECEHRTCTAGVCGSTREAAGTILVVQTTGNCKRRQCAADGTVADANDDTDVPEDRNPCTNDICTSGTPSHTMMPANSNCGGANYCNASGQCVGCAVAADCPGTDTACRTRTCTAGGVCGFTFAAANTRLVDPTAGDCRGLQCDGAGNSQVFNDNGDLPIDGNACTTDECSSGTASHRPVPSGTACGGSLVCDGASNCVECLSASTCPGTDAECRTRSCVSGQCGISNTPNGTLVGNQTPRDCRATVCNGQGSTAIINDSLDLPVDGNPCTQDVCTAGMPSNPFVSAGNSCGANTICDGQGACVSCLTASSCPGTDTDCRVRTCTNGACGMANVADGTAVPGQTAGNCRRAVCMSGNESTVNDDADLPVDGNPCTDDICTDGVPTNPNRSTGTSCGGTQVCNGQGACVGCNTAADCGTNTTCQTHTCTNGTCGVTNAAAGTPLPTQTAGDCQRVQCNGQGQSQTVDDDTDVPVDGNACTRDVCTGGVASNPPETAGATCNQSGGNRCNGSGTAPACVQCLVATDCPGGPDTECRVRTCSAAGVCGISNTANGTPVTSQTPGDCQRNVCMNGNQVATDDNADLPADGNACTQDLCTAGVPSNPPQAQNTPCSENGGTRCNGSATAPACVQCNAPADCGANTECQMRTCSATGQCGVNNIGNGTALASQTAGDCQTAVCNGNGGTAQQANNADLPVDGNDCTFDLCTAGTPSNPPRPTDDPCSQNNGSRCNGSLTTPACVQCNQPANCGTDTACRTFACSAAGMCSSTDAPEDTVVSNAPVGNCHTNVCRSGVITNVVNNNDVFDDGNPCTADECMTGTPQNPNLASGVSCGGGLVCNGNGACVGCLTDANCPTDPGNSCRTPVCNNGTCGFNNVGAGTVVTVAPPGDCHRIECNDNGMEVPVVFNADLPSTGGNQCIEAVCTAGTPSLPPLNQGTTCNQNNGNQCNAGMCVQCIVATDCPGGPDTFCSIRTCTNGVCGIDLTDAGTPVPTQVSGDCKRNVCNGEGIQVEAPDDTDPPADPNECIAAMCVGGVAMNSNRAHGTACTVDGRTCNGSGACTTTFSVIRVGDGVAGLTSAGAALFIEERNLSDGSLVMTTALPAAASGGNQPIVQSGSSSSEGSLSLSGDGRYLIVAGYAAIPGTADVAAASSINRVVGRVDAASPAGVNTTTTMSQSVVFAGNNFRGATSQDGTSFWVSGAGSGTTGGVWWVGLGGTPAPAQVTPTLTNTRWVHIFAGQLFGSSNTNPFPNVFAIGTGLPQSASTVVALPGMPTTTGPSPFSFVLLDRNPSVIGFDTLYVADDDGTANQGIQKWTLAATGGNWTRAATFNVSPAVDFKGLAGLVTGNDVTLIGTTAETTNRIVKFVDTGSGSPTVTVIGTSASNRMFRGVALSPRL